MNVAVITGATAGIGFETAKQLAQKGFRVIHLSRNEEKARKVDSLIKTATGNNNVSHIICDLADMKSVKTAVAKLKEETRRIDVLVNNAGGVVNSDERSKDGIDMHFAINHLGHFYLTNLLMNELLASKARIINVSSEAHKIGYLNFDIIKKDKGLSSGFKGYGDAKLCNVLFTKELHRRYSEQGLTTYCLHPGVVSTSFGHNMKGLLGGIVKFSQLFMITPAKGAATSVYLATGQGLEKYSGGYYKRSRLASPASRANNIEDAKKLWELSEYFVNETVGK